MRDFHVGGVAPARNDSGYYPCLCLCLGFSQITITLPCLLIILHFSHIFFTEGLTFINIIPFLLSKMFNCALSLIKARLFCSPSDPAAGQVVGRHLYGHLIAGEDADEVHSQLA